MAFTLYDFVDEDSKNVISSWRDGLTIRSKAQLDNKLHMLEISGSSLPPKLLAGPIKKTGHIYKLIIHADVMLRPMLCRGPFEMDTEFTLLVGAKEIQGKLIPGPESAVKNRATLLADRRRRIPHVW
ncbi:MAG: hypothetical protein ABR898_11315 [Terracidiphilus sp.]